MHLHRRITPARLEQLGLLAALALYAATVLAYLDFVPIWDGLAYSRDCLVKAVTGPFSLMSFNCFAHPTMAYVLLLALPQYLDPGNVALLHLTNMLLGMVSIVALHFVLRRLLPAKQLWPERVLVTAIYAGLPLFLANTLNMTPDFGVLVFFLLTLALLLHRRLALAAAAGVLLVFSKEVGVLLYGVMLASFCYFYVARAQLAGREKLRALLGRWPLGIAPVLFVSFYVYKATVAGPLLWTASETAKPANLLRAFTSFSLLDLSFLGNVRGIFLLNFNWILTLPVAALVIWRVVQFGCGLRRGAPSHAPARELGYVLTLFFVVFLLLTRFPTYINLRYMLPVYPLLLLFFIHALCVFLRNHKLRVALLAVTLVLIFASNFWTFDPLSKKAYGTFRFGSREMINMTRTTGECCGYGRDQLVYNLQYTRLDSVMTKIFQHLKPRASEVYLAHSGFRDIETPQADFYLVGTIHNKSYTRTLLKQHDLGLRTRRLRKLVLWKTKPKTIYYIEFPNYDSTRELRVTNMLYRVEWIRRYGDADYYIRVFKFALR